MPSTSDEFLESSARVLRSSMDMIVSPLGPKEFLSQPLSVIREALMDTPAYNLLDPDSPEVCNAIIATAKKL